MSLSKMQYTFASHNISPCNKIVHPQNIDLVSSISVKIDYIGFAEVVL